MLGLEWVAEAAGRCPEEIDLWEGERTKDKIIERTNIDSRYYIRVPSWSPYSHPIYRTINIPYTDEEMRYREGKQLA